MKNGIGGLKQMAGSRTDWCLVLEADGRMSLERDPNPAERSCLRVPYATVLVVERLLGRLLTRGEIARMIQKGSL